MNRWLIAVVIGIAVGGCAAGVDDPQPGEQAIEPGNPPPAQTFAGELDVPYDVNAAKGINEGNGNPGVPVRPVEVGLRPPMPGDRIDE